MNASSRSRRPLPTFGLPEQYRKAAEKDVFDHLDQTIVVYSRAEAHEELPAALSDPLSSISDELKKLSTFYIPDLQARMIQLSAGELDSRESYRYWLPYFPPAFCLYESVERYPGGSVKQIVPNRICLPSEPIFRIGGMHKYRVVVEPSVAESILRRSPYGVDLTPVKVR